MATGGMGEKTKTKMGQIGLYQCPYEWTRAENEFAFIGRCNPLTLEHCADVTATGHMFAMEWELVGKNFHLLGKHWKFNVCTRHV